MRQYDDIENCLLLKASVACSYMTIDKVENKTLCLYKSHAQKADSLHNRVKKWAIVVG